MQNAPASTAVAIATRRCMSGRLRGINAMTNAPTSGVTTMAVSTGNPLLTGARAASRSGST